MKRAFNRLLRAPVYALTCVVTLALGIAATVAVFSVVQGVLLQPLPFPDPDRLVSLQHRAPGITAGPAGMSEPLYVTYAQASRRFEAVGMYRSRLAVITGLDRPEQVAALEVSQSLLALLGVSAAHGRLFRPEDDSPGAADTVLLGHGYWQRRLGGDPGAVNSTLRIDGRPHRVLGVLPASFELPNQNAAIYVPARIDHSNPELNDFTLTAIARLLPGVSIASANADIERMLPLSAERFGWTTKEGLESMQYGPDLRPLRDEYVGNVETALFILLGTAGLVLLIACSNVANLFLVRAEGRQQEVALRTALGSSRLGIAGLFLAESMTLALLGGALGTALALAGLELLLGSEVPFLPRVEEIGVDLSVLLFALGMSLVSGLIVGFFPVIRLRGRELVGALKEGGRGAIGDQRHRSRRFLVMVQVAMTFVLLVASGLMIRSFRALESVDLGVERAQDVLTFRVTVPEAEIRSSEQVALALEQIQHAFEGLPGVVSVGATQWAPMGRGGSGEVFWVEGMGLDPGRIPPVRRVKGVTPNYFATQGTPLVAGRSISWDDIQGRGPVAVISEALAREWWSDPTVALGKRITMPHPSVGFVWRDVIGVVADVHEDSPGLDPPSMVYWPIAGMNLNRSFEGLWVPRSLVYLLRAEGRDAAGLLPEARRALGDVNANLPISEEATLQDLLDRALAPTSFTLSMLLVAAGVALALGMVGVYAVMSYIVVQRRREIGVRMAFGAATRDILVLIGRQGLGLAGAGILVGLLAALGLTRLMSALLFGVRPADPLTFVVVAALLSLMVLIACYFPARRASRVSPVDALHGE